MFIMDALKKSFCILANQPANKTEKPLIQREMQRARPLSFSALHNTLYAIMKLGQKTNTVKKSAESLQRVFLKNNHVFCIKLAIGK